MNFYRAKIRLSIYLTACFILQFKIDAVKYWSQMSSILNSAYFDRILSLAVSFYICIKYYQLKNRELKKLKISFKTFS